MKLTVFGASGAIGGHVVRQALDAGHKVTAVVRASSGFDVPDVEIVKVPGLTDPAALVPAVAGADAVISGVGPRRLKDAGVASATHRVLLAAMAAAGVRRFVTVTAAPVIPPSPEEPWLVRRVVYPFISTAFRKIYEDYTTMENEIRQSATDWTVVRPPRLTNKPLSGKYRIALEANPRGLTIPRADVAHAMLGVLKDPGTIGHAIGVAG
jgi:putative NADH-flavin reductase